MDKQIADRLEQAMARYELDALVAYSNSFNGAFVFDNSIILQDSRIKAFTHALERSSRFLAGLCRLDCRISADCEPAQPASEAVERTPTLAAVFRDAQRKAWECGIEILDAPARWRLSPFNKQVCELSRWHPRLCYAG